MADSDKDGLTDEFERRIGTDPFDKDSDNDGLTDKAERTLGTNPKNFDSDGDGYMDGSEFAQSKSPTHPDPPNPYADRWGQRDKPFRATPDDPDADGLDTMQERMLKTNPNDPDTDGDGIGDGMESIGNRGRSPIKPEPIPSPTPAPKSTAIPTADDTLVASNAPMSAGTADPRDAFLGATRAPTDTDDGLTDGPVTSPSEVDDSLPNTDADTTGHDHRRGRSRRHRAHRRSRTRFRPSPRGFVRATPGRVRVVRQRRGRHRHVRRERRVRRGRRIHRGGDVQRRLTATTRSRNVGG